MKALKLDKSLIALNLAILIWLAACGAGIAEFAFPRIVYTCEFTLSGHTDENASGPDIFYVTLANEDSLIRTIRVDAEDVYNTNVKLPVTVEETQSRFLGVTLDYNLYITEKHQPHYDECDTGDDKPANS